MAAVNAHVLLGSPRRFGSGLYPEFLAMLRDAAKGVRWQIENLAPEKALPFRSVVTVRPEHIAVGLAVAIHTALESPFLYARLGPTDNGSRHMEGLADVAIEAIDGDLVQNAVGLSATICWQTESPFRAADADAIVRYLTGDIEACTTVWTQFGSGHDGFATPGRRWINPAWGSDV